ncbi:MAG TPA: hypothetical protein VFA20_24645 [Myxococcaceae bacterium]|nr:hypothetical protein [Myxococcaceae bacterium]
MKKVLVLLCSLFALAAVAAPVDGPPPPPPPIGGGGSSGNCTRLNGIWENGQNMNGHQSQARATGFKAPNAAVRGGKLFIRVAK